MCCCFWLLVCCLSKIKLKIMMDENDEYCMCLTPEGDDDEHEDDHDDLNASSQKQLLIGTKVWKLLVKMIDVCSTMMMIMMVMML